MKPPNVFCIILGVGKFGEKIIISSSSQNFNIDNYYKDAIIRVSSMGGISGTLPTGFNKEWMYLINIVSDSTLFRVQIIATASNVWFRVYWANWYQWIAV